MKLLWNLLFAGILIFCSCKQNVSEETSLLDDIETIELSEESVTPLEIVNRRDTLIISYQGTECGEWGGHKETIFLQRNENDKITARILIDEVPCDDIIEKNGIGILNPKKRKIVVDYTKTLNLNDEQLFNEFLQRLMELYLKPLVIGNFGSYYIVKNTDNSLKFRYWNSGNVMNTNYTELKEKVFEDFE